MTEAKTMTLNMGPHHPATHGVLRLVLELDGETIIKATPHVGQLHRGIEKIAESMNFQQVIPLTDRLDYTAASLNNLGYCMTVEKLLGIEVPKRAQYIRVIMSELARIMGHHLWIGSHALDLGAMTLIFYTFRDREMIMNINEELSGYRLTPSFLRIGGVAKDITLDFVKSVRDFVKWFPKAVEGYNTLLTDNIIWRKRTMGIGSISAEEAVNYGMTGPSLRGSGVSYDIRKALPYCSYDDFDFQIPVGENGDVYDRYLVRMEEFKQSLRIIDQAIENLPEGPIKADNPWVSNPETDEVTEDISSLIRRFKIQSEGPKSPIGEVYHSVEGSKGELGFYLVGDGTAQPYRMKIRSPCFILTSALPRLLKGHMIADAISIIGSIDIVLGEIDR
jgi:NADH-quinone oxidoreductase subunit D